MEEAPRASEELTFSEASAINRGTRAPKEDTKEEEGFPLDNLPKVNLSIEFVCGLFPVNGESRTPSTSASFFSRGVGSLAEGANARGKKGPACCGHKASCASAPSGRHWELSFLGITIEREKRRRWRSVEERKYGVTRIRRAARELGWGARVVYRELAVRRGPRSAREVNELGGREPAFNSRERYRQETFLP
ncbi:hypothetical protein KM043_004229 [Ampulex compressa]|nr:hypothetical protein KM043_004229 [Ampulex compressa]